jgi:hypothetical protein
MLRPSSLAFLLCLLASLAGCGGTVASGSDAGSAGSVAGSGGSAAGAGGSTGGSLTAGGSGAAGSQPGDCPADRPMSGDPCNLPEDQTCSYGDMCCPDQFGCFMGMWNQYDIDCGAPMSCPPDPPQQGAACNDICAQWSPCGYACAQGMAAFAECAEGAWQISAAACSPDAVPCEDQSCAGGQVCVTTAGGAGLTSTCADDPCQGQPLSCECAAALCGGSMYECHVDAPSQVSCVCSMCP